MASAVEPDPYENDEARWGHSLGNLAEMLVGCLDARGAKSVLEIGAYAGDLTQLLLEWASGVDGRVIAVEPVPQPRLKDLSERRPDLELIQKPSQEVLPELILPDAVVIDGDHNYYTVSEELRLIGEQTSGTGFPLLLMHDVGWPHGRRDAYYSLADIPPEHRPLAVERPFIFPGDPGVATTGLPMYAAAEREGGSRNGVMTALEDFVTEREHLSIAVVPPFFGLAVVWPREAAWASAVAELVKPWDCHPVLERLESNRVHHLAMAHRRGQKLAWATGRLAEEMEANVQLRRELDELRRLECGEERPDRG